VPSLFLLLTFRCSVRTGSAVRLRGTWHDGSAVAAIKDLKPTADQDEAPILDSARELQVSKVDVLGPSDPQV
jgi:hypothetical protein